MYSHDCTKILLVFCVKKYCRAENRNFNTDFICVVFKQKCHVVLHSLLDLIQIQDNHIGYNIGFIQCSVFMAFSWAQLRRNNQILSRMMEQGEVLGIKGLR